MPIVRVSWSAPATIGGSPITGYVVQRRTGTGTWTQLAVTAAIDRGYDDLTVADGTQYGYQLAAVNRVGTGPFSAEATVTLPTPPPATTPYTSTYGATY